MLLEATALVLAGKKIYDSIYAARDFYRKRIIEICSSTEGLYKKLGENIYTPVLVDISKKTYGYRLVLTAPDGISFEKIISKKEELRTGLRCENIIFTTDMEAGIIVLKLIKKQDIISYYPVEIKWNELYLGEKIDGSDYIVDLFKSPHPLISGHTGTGKTQLSFMAILNKVFSNTPREFQFYLAQSAKSEWFTRGFHKLPHCKATARDLDSLVELYKKVAKEIKNRETILENANCINLKDYNKKNKNKLPMLFLIGEEFSFFMPDNSDSKEDKEQKAYCLSVIRKVAKIGRALGINNYIIIQRMSADNIDSTTKSQCLKISGWQNSKINSNIAIDSDEAYYLNKENYEFIASLDETTYFRAPFFDDEVAIYCMNLANQAYNKKLSEKQIQSDDAIKQKVLEHQAPVKNENCLSTEIDKNLLAKVAAKYINKINANNKDAIFKEFYNKFKVDLEEFLPKVNKNKSKGASLDELFNS